MAIGDEHWERHARDWAHKNAWRWDGSIQRETIQRKRDTMTGKKAGPTSDMERAMLRDVDSPSQRCTLLLREAWLAGYKQAIEDVRLSAQQEDES